jgi:hydroxymethylpyrimidine pyrophosphatase-like HAD family hydrolase
MSYDIQKKIIAVDFDGTCTTHDYPKVGKEIGAAPVLKQLVAAGSQLILFTMRSGQELQDAVDWFAKHEIPLYGINENPTQKNWTKSPKAYAQIYIDDAALGCPLEWNKELSDRPFVDWADVKTYLQINMII